MYIDINENEAIALRSLFEKINAQDPVKKNESKWVRKDGFIVNIYTGRKMDLKTKKFYPG